MLEIKEDNTIQLTRGDTARLRVPLLIKVDEEHTVDYEMDENDTLTLSIKKSAKDEISLTTKVAKGTNVIHIEPIDTKHLSFAKYKYDVELVTGSGDTYTVIQHKTFEILPEVTW
jgi:hypothetical protein